MDSQDRVDAESEFCRILHIVCIHPTLVADFLFFVDSGGAHLRPPDPPT